MLRGRCSAVLGMVLMLATSQAEAREVGLFVEGRIGGDSNVLRSGQEKVEDGFFEISPRISLSEKHRQFNYDIAYRPTFRTFAETEDIDGLDHLARGNGTWRVTPLDALSFSFRYSNQRQLRAEQILDDSGQFFPEPSDRSRLRRTNAQLRYSRQLTPDWSAFLAADVDDFDPTPDGRRSQADTRAYSLRGGGDHAFDEKTSAGFSLAGRFRDTRVQRFDFNETDAPDVTSDLIDPREDRRVPSSKTLTWDLSFNLSRQISETMRVSVQVGPSFISTKLVPDIFFRRDAALPDGDDTIYDQQTSIFAGASFDKRWSKSRFTANYSRSEFRGGFTTSATISDDVTVRGVHEWNRRLVSRLDLGWNRRVQIVDVPGLNNLDTTQWRAVLVNTYRINRKLSLIGQYAFLTQDIDGGVNSPGVGDTHTGFLSLRYTFDPIIF
ncbi:MAG: hypothetical protein AB8G23_00200 [Myxococcota bacterium]